jgi:hypothetical protein
MRRVAAAVAVFAGLGLGLPSEALADRVYRNCGECNAACHGACFMLGEGCLCKFGALRAKSKNLGEKSQNYNKGADTQNR